MSRFIIYALIDPRTQAVRYVGRSCSGLRRPREHANYARLGRQQHCERWIRQLQALDLDYEIVVLEELTEADWLDVHERWWIAFARAWGCPLTNLTDGGAGAPGFSPSDETRALLHQTSCAAHARPEVRARHSAATSAAMAQPEIKARQSLGLRASRATAASKAKFSAIMQTVHQRPGFKASHSAAVRAVMSQPAVKAKMREAQRATQARPDVKAAQRAGLLAWHAARATLATQWGPF